MAINFIVNDPMAGDPPTMAIAPTPDRSAAHVRFVISGLPAEGAYDAQSTDFVFWQSREAALRTLNVFEDICGDIVGWEGRTSRKTLKLIPNEGNDINAYYDRASISFFEAQVGAKKVFSGASSDVVAHEAGHAILDALRPDLWDVSMMEVAAFHEGFGDCIAIMLALSDPATRKTIVAAPGDLGSPNFVEATAEELSNAIRRAVGPNHNAAAPRRALNQFQWALPQTLPEKGPPGVLINESHSLGQLVSGIYYDLIAGLFSQGPKTQVRLWNSCKTATRLLVEATRSVPVTPRFFESWGRTMLTWDQSHEDGANAVVIKNAFAGHSINISAAGFLTPLAALSTRRRFRGAKKVTLSEGSRGKLREVLRIDPGSALHTRMVDIGETPVTEVASNVEVDLTGLSERLANVVTHVPRQVLVGESDGTQAILGMVQPAMLYSSEVRDFVATLVSQHAIDFERKGKKASKRSSHHSGAGYLAKENAITHAIVVEDGAPQLKRVSFSCGCRAR